MAPDQIVELVKELGRRLGAMKCQIGRFVIVVGFGGAGGQAGSSVWAS
jgi:hypothetical protein